MAAESVTIEIHLTVAEQRKIVEHEAGGPCFRMWLTDKEASALRRMHGTDFTMHPLEDGRWAQWRKESDMDTLHSRGDMVLWNELNARRLSDDVA